MPHEPKRRHSRGRQGKRRASINLAIPSFIKCSNCGENYIPHSVCTHCGFYDGKQVAMLKKEKPQNENGQ